MPITKRLITNAAVLLALVAATLLGVGYLTAPPHVAQGHDGGSYDGTGHARGEHHTHSNRAWNNGSRCIGPGHIANKHTNSDGTLVLGPHTGFASSEYTTGAGRGTSTAKNLRLTKDHIEDTWEVQLTWRPAGWKAGSNTWGCQPHTFQAQRKIENGPWEPWNTSHPNSNRYSEITTQRKWSRYGGLADYSLYKHPTTGTPETVHFRVCNKDQDGTIGACTGPVSTSLGGNPWHPEIEAAVTNKPVWESTSALQVSVTANPPPPDGATDVTVEVSFNVDKADDDFEVVTSHNVSISAAGTGSLSVTNPFTRTGTDFTEDRSEPMRVKLTGGANSKDTHQFTLNVLDDDPVPITVFFPDDDPATYAVGGPNNKPANLNPSGSANHPKRFQVGFHLAGKRPHRQHGRHQMSETRRYLEPGLHQQQHSGRGKPDHGVRLQPVQGRHGPECRFVQHHPRNPVDPCQPGLDPPHSPHGRHLVQRHRPRQQQPVPVQTGSRLQRLTFGSGRRKPTHRHGERVRLPRPP